MDRGTAQDDGSDLKRTSSVESESQATTEELNGLEDRLNPVKDQSSIRRCLSESQVLGTQDDRDSSETSSSTGVSEVFPSLPDVVLHQLGVAAAATKTSEVLSEQDVESRFCSLSLAFKTDKLTLVSRHDRQQRQRDQSERNMAAEVMKLKAVVSNLNYLCKDSESIDILTRIQDQVDVLQRSTERVSSSAEIYGAVQQETRVSRAIEVMLLHVENLKRLYEKQHTELEESRRVLQENNIVIEGGADTTESPPLRNRRYNSLASLVTSGIRGRRASIGAFARPIGIQDSSKNSTTTLTFGEIKSNVRTVPHSRRSSLAPSACHIENPVPGWDLSDRPDVAAASMENIKELSEIRRNSLTSKESRTSPQEENNNSRKSSRCDGSLQDRLIFADQDTTVGSNSLTDDQAEDFDSFHSAMSGGTSPVRSLRENALDLLSQAHEAIMDNIVPLNVDYVLIQTRRCATVLLLVAALWSLLSTFVPTSAQSRQCLKFSWYSLQDILQPYVQLRHYGPPPT